MARAAKQEATEETSLRDDMEAAFDEIENADPEPGTDTPDDYTQTPAATEAPAETPTEVQPAAPAPSELQAEVSRNTGAARDVKPPVDWSPSLREHWGKMAPEVREKIAARERDVAVMLQNTSAERHLAQDFMRRAEPYRALMAAEGVQNPMDAFDGLMKVTAVLAMGAPQQKADRIAGLVKHYGVDIEMLDQALAGSLPAPNPQETALQRMLEERMAPVNQLLQRVTQAEQQQGQQLYGQAHQTIEQFGSDGRNEFFEYVRGDMADFLDMAAQRGVSMSLKEAYDRACAINPEIQRVTSTRRQPQSLADKRRAASSVAGRGTDTSQGGGEISLREELESHFGDDSRI